MSSKPSSSRARIFRLHGLFTIDQNDEPYGEASTDPSALEPDGPIGGDFCCVIQNGYEVIPVSFEVVVPDELLQSRSTTLVATLVENPTDTRKIIDAKDCELQKTDRLPQPLQQDVSTNEEPAFISKEVKDDPFEDRDDDLAWLEEESEHD